MHQYLALLRGVNVGGKNKLPMAALRHEVEQLGYEDVRTFIQSGNVLFAARNLTPSAQPRGLLVAKPARRRLVGAVHGATAAPLRRSSPAERSG